MRTFIVAFVASVSFVAWGVTTANAANQPASVSTVAAGAGQIKIVGRNFRPSSPIVVKISCAGVTSNLNATSDSLGRFGVLTKKPANCGGRGTISAAVKTSTVAPSSGAAPAPAAAKVTGPVVYVAANGSDSNDGKTAAHAKKTIKAGIDAASAGTTVLVGPGTYDGVVTVDKGGSAGKFLTVRSSTKHGAIINGNPEQKSQAAVELNSPYVRFQDFEITGTQGTREGIIIGADNLQIVGNEIHNICNFLTGNTSWKGGAGIDISKSPVTNLVIDGNLIHDIGAPGSTEELVHGMYLSAHATNAVVSNNVIYKVEDFGLHPYDETEASGWAFINNTIAFTGRGILQAPNGITRNNIVYKVRGNQFQIRGDGNVVQNNLAFGGNSDSSDGVTQADPMFVNPDKFDFRLKPGSPAINKGSTALAPKTDFLGMPRPKGGGIDIGAYEQG